MMGTWGLSSTCPTARLRWKHSKRSKRNPWESKLGGCPYLHSAEEYPIGENGKPMLFLAQINLEDIHNLPELPKSGLLQFFVAQDGMIGASLKPAVRWIEQVDKRKEGLLTENPYENEAYWKELPFETPGRMSFEEDIMTEDDIDPDYCIPEESNRVGGYPSPIQGDLEDFHPDKELVLLHLFEHGGCQLGFGDSGTAFFVISRKDLAARDFSNVTYTWDCC